MNSVDRAIWTKFHVKHNDSLPYIGFTGTRDTLGELFAELGYKSGAEVGVQRGAFSQVLCKAVPGLRLKCVDTWAPFTHHSQSWQDRQYERAVERLKGYNVEFVKAPSVEAAKSVADKTLDFVYIDALHDFDSVMADILAWAPKVRPGGILSGHDYDIAYRQGVIQAVNAYTHAHAISMYYVTPLDNPRSWFWVSP